MKGAEASTIVYRYLVKQKRISPIEDEMILGSVVFTKVDEDNSEKTLEGAIFELQDAEGNTLKETLTTNNKGKLIVNDLKPGKYQFIETKSPANYILDITPVSFEIIKG